MERCASENTILIPFLNDAPDYFLFYRRDASFDIINDLRIDGRVRLTQKSAC